MNPHTLPEYPTLIGFFISGVTWKWPSSSKKWVLMLDSNRTGTSGQWTFCLGALNNCPWMRYSELFDLLVDYLNNAWKWNRKLDSDLHSEACFIYILRTWTINFTIYLFLAPNYYAAFSHVHFNDFLKLLKFLRFWNINLLHAFWRKNSKSYIHHRILTPKSWTWVELILSVRLKGLHFKCMNVLIARWNL